MFIAGPRHRRANAVYKRHRAPIIVRCTASAHPRETTSRAGNNYTTFKLEDQSGSCAVNIFIWGYPPLSNNDHVRVDGVFETEHHQGHYTFYNEVQGTKVTPVPQ